MPKATRIYTRTGDKGMTGLVGGGRIKKSALRIETYGTVDELSSAIGVARASLRSLVLEHPRAARLDAWLSWVQDGLFNLGSELATLPKDRRDGQAALRDGDVHALERAIDEATRDLPPLSNFIHPGGSLPARSSISLAPFAGVPNAFSSRLSTRRSRPQMRPSAISIDSRMPCSFGHGGSMTRSAFPSIFGITPAGRRKTRSERPPECRSSPSFSRRRMPTSFAK